MADSAIKLSVLHLRDFWLESFRIAQGDSEKIEAGVPINIEVGMETHKHPSEEKAFGLKSIFRFGPSSDLESNDGKTLPYDIEVIVWGDFIFQAEIPLEAMELHKQISAPSILYGIARAFVAQSTAMFSAGKFILPTVRFTERKTKAIQAKNKPRKKVSGE